MATPNALGRAGLRRLHLEVLDLIAVARLYGPVEGPGRCAVE